MEEMPLYKAAFHQRRADRNLRHNRFDEAISSLEEGLQCISNAYNDIKTPTALQVVEVLEDEYKRQINRIKLQKAYCEGCKNAQKEQKISVAEEAVECANSTNSNELQLAIDRTIQDFDARYSTKCSNKESNKEIKTNLDNEKTFLATYAELDVDLPPLELPTFDFSSFTQTE